MGPQSFDCGNSDVRSTDCSHPECFNGAAVFRLRKLENCDAIVVRGNYASMGPQSCDCGNRRKLSSTSDVESASMGPQSFDCGNLAGSQRQASRATASMGPQSCDCGNLEPKLRFTGRVRRFNGAAVLRLRKQLPLYLSPIGCPIEASGIQSGINKGVVVSAVARLRPH